MRKSFFLALFLSAFCSWAVSFSTASDTDSSDFFAETSEQNEGDDFSGSSLPAESSEKGKDAGSFIADLLGADSTDDGKSAYHTPIEDVLPRTGLMLARTAPVSKLNESLTGLLKNFGFGKLSPIDWVRISPYGKAFKYVDQMRPLGAFWFFFPGGKEPSLAILVPVRHYCPFAEMLGADISGFENDEAIPQGKLFSLKKPEGWVSFHAKGYAVILKEAGSEFAAANLFKTAPIGPLLHKQVSLKEPDLRIQVTPYGVRRFTDLNGAMYSEIWALLPDILARIKDSNPDFDLTPGEIHPRLINFSKWVSQNLRQLVWEVKLTSDSVLVSSIFLPDAGLELARNLESRGGVDIPTLLDQPEFLKVLPTAPAPISGQTDIYPDWAEQLEPPFNRIRHVEYSIGVPQKGELLAESWGFFLEVDDSEQFVRELIVPKARMIGSHIGAEQVGEIAGQILGNMSLRRQMRGRRPLIYDSPDSAAMAGREIGEAIGSQIGTQLGEDQAMKKFDFEGYPLYVSDMELYIREMRKIALEDAGKKPVNRPAVLTGEPTIRILLSNLISGVENGSIDGMIRDRVLADGANMDDLPLPVRENLILVLDKKHILIVPGNRDLLKAAVEKWEDLLARKGEPVESRDTDDWKKNRNTLYKEMLNGELQMLRSAARFDLAAAQAEAEYLRQSYQPQLFPPLALTVPPELSAPIFIGTDTRDMQFLYAVFPDEFLKFLIDAAQEQQKKSRK